MIDLMPNSTVSGVAFDPNTRAPQYIEVVVTANAVDPNTGANPGVVDTTTPLIFTYNQGGPGPGGAPPAVVTLSETKVTAIGARVVRMTPGVLPIGATDQPFSVRISAAGRTDITIVTGITPAPTDISGVAFNGVGPIDVEPN